jgi:hypothetical protein
MESIEQQIYKKQSYNNAFYSKPTCVLVDMEQFPYTRYYRGKVDSKIPILYNREAGWSPLASARQELTDIPPHEFCWEKACSFIKPCVASGKREPTPYYYMSS